MTEEHEQVLLKSFPDLYITSGLGFPKFVGFECGDGWFELIHQLSKDIQYELDQQFGQESRVLYAVQVKEKYGSLRFYMNEMTPEIDILITHAETESTKTCEMCGKPGKMRNTSWIRTLCDDHHRT